MRNRKMLKKICLLAVFVVTLIASNIYSPAANSKVSSIKELKEASVMVECRTRIKKRLLGGGSGTRIYHEPGKPWVLLTAAHVTLSCKHDLTVTIYRDLTDDEGNVYKRKPIYVKLKEIAVFPQRDISVLRTKKSFKDRAAYVSIAKSTPAYASHVWTAGYPSPLRSSGTFVTSKGIINTPDLKLKLCKFPARTPEEIRELPDNDLFALWECQPFPTENFVEYRYILSDSDINFGNSGGALVNKKLELIGVTVMSIRMGNKRTLSVPVEDIIKLIKTTPYASKIFKQGK